LQVPSTRRQIPSATSSMERPMICVQENCTAPDFQAETPLPTSVGICTRPAKKNARNALKYRVASVRDRKPRMLDAMNRDDPRILFCKPWCQNVLQNGCPELAPETAMTGDARANRNLRPKSSQGVCVAERPEYRTPVLHGAGLQTDGHCGCE
jgi:hypothetical protein